MTVFPERSRKTEKRKRMMNEKNEQKRYHKSNRVILIGCICSVAFLLLVTIGSMIIFRENMMRRTKALNEADYETYDAYYAMIVSDHTSAFWQSVYESTKEAGRDCGVYVEMMGSNLSTDYDKEELLQIAIASKVDGIILEADESGAITRLLEEAQKKEIPVVTVFGDNSQGLRKSFIGVSNYNLGREYGRQVLDIRDKEIRDVLVLMSLDSEDTSRNIVYAGISETLAQEGVEGTEGMQVRAAVVENKGAFDTEESIRKIFIEEGLPDVVICLDELSTSCVYQAVVDYNVVGQIDIIGYYDSETILKAIERNVVRATISIDTKEMGQYCVEALEECRRGGYVSEYFSVGTNLITIQNVREYLGGEEDE